MPAPESPPLPPLRETIAAHGLAAKKSLGQNFLLDLNLTGRIARAGSAQGSQVYEVGPGPGGLTRALLAEGATVVAVERDDRCIAALMELAQAYPGQLEIVSDDALKVDEARLFDGTFRIIANLPYNIATVLLVKWLTQEAWPPRWQSLTLMFQKEVAQRICALPGEPGYGRLSVLTAYRAQAKILFDIARTAFVPPPKVTSSVVRIEPLTEPAADCDLAVLERLTAAAFGQRRKMLRQSLKSVSPDAAGLCTAASIDATRRAETLSVVEFAALARALRNRNETQTA